MPKATVSISALCQVCQPSFSRMIFCVAEDEAANKQQEIRNEHQSHSQGRCSDSNLRFTIIPEEPLSDVCVDSPPDEGPFDHYPKGPYPHHT